MPTANVSAPADVNALRVAVRSIRDKVKALREELGDDAGLREIDEAARAIDHAHHAGPLADEVYASALSKLARGIERVTEANATDLEEIARRAADVRALLARPVERLTVERPTMIVG